VSAVTRVALITGTLSDIGQETARALGALGYSIVVNHRGSEERAEELAAALVAEGGAPLAIAVQADVRERAQVHSLFDQAYRELESVDVLVNNAGTNRDRAFVDLTDEDWDTVIETVLGGTFLCSQEFARRYSGGTGNIVNIGAVTALKGRKNGANYCSARAGVLALTRCLALELAPQIRVNTVTPGRIDTAELESRYRLGDPANRARLEQDVPLERLGRPEDVAETIAFLVSADRYVTGQNFFVDGGLYMH
jgi:3-oxoacyl-[acyl-carrier protein] reductase